jgi:thiol-disulfide isomerase/thioredoxin
LSLRPALQAGLAASALFFVAASGGAQADAEGRVLDYIRDHVKPGQPLIVTELYNQVFTQPEERKALNKLYNAFFRIPLFVAQYQGKFGSPPSLRVISEQFDLRTPQASEILLRVMESDPRVPRFLTRDPKTGEITRVDVERIQSDPRFGQALARQLSGWEGQPAPEFKLTRIGGGDLDLAAWRGEVTLLYVWFTGCPPCMKETPSLIELHHDYAGGGLHVVGANADRFLGLDYDDSVRLRYLAEQKVKFPIVHWTRESDQAYGGVSIFPTLFLIDRKGIVLQHWIGYTEPNPLRRAVSKALEEK